MKLPLPHNKILAALVILFGIGLVFSFLPLVIGGGVAWFLYKKVPQSKMKIAGLVSIIFITLFATVAWANGISSTKSTTSVEGITTTIAPTPTDAPIPTPTSVPVTPHPTVTPLPTNTLIPIPTPTVIYIPRIPTPTTAVVQQSTDTSSGLSNDNYYTNGNGNQVHSPAYSNNDSVPAGATAKCGDGTYSFSQSSRGTCSHHGGVAQWL